MRSKRLILTQLGLCLCLFAHSVFSQTEEFTYQGRLLDGSLPPTANYDFEFKLFDAPTNGTQLDSTIQLLGVPVTNGIFTVQLDFGASFSGAARFLEISVKNAPGPFTILVPRQPITSGPYAIRSLNSVTAGNALDLGGVPANQYVVTTDTRLTDDRNPIPNSGHYVQNQNAGPQSSSNFHISGNGTALGTLSGNIVNSATQYNIGASRVLSVTGTENVFAGVNAGAANTGGQRNAFFGAGAGQSNATGLGNAFFGARAGQANQTGSDNAFFGTLAGNSHTIGDGNSFFGSFAGQANSAGDNNSLFGRNAGFSNTASDNSFFGSGAGFSNTTGNQNTFFGRDTGFANTTGSDNAFFGRNAGRSNNASSNAFFGARAGEANSLGGSNAFFGQSAGRANTEGNFNSFFGRSAGILNTTGASNSFFGSAAGDSNDGGRDNAFYGATSGSSNDAGSDNAFFGRSSGLANTIGNNNSALGSGADVGANNLLFATAIGSDAVVTTSNRIQLGRDGTDTVRIGRLASLGAIQLCRDGLVIAACSSSARYKENIRPFTDGLSLVRKFQPVTFDWIGREEPGLGLIAEEVEKIEPLLVTYNQKRQVQGVKYDQIAVVAINAIKEQQVQIDEQRIIIEEQQEQIDELKQIVCLLMPDAAPCDAERN